MEIVGLAAVSVVWIGISWMAADSWERRGGFWPLALFVALFLGPVGVIVLALARPRRRVPPEGRGP